MTCEYCHRTIRHHYRCPNYLPPKPDYYCTVCGNGILPGDDFVKNFEGEYVHYDCLTDLSYRAMIEWLGGEIMTMEDDDD